MSWRHLGLVVMAGLFAWLAYVISGEAPPQLAALVALVGIAGGVWYGEHSFLPSFRAAQSGIRPSVQVPLLPIAIFAGMYLLPKLFPAVGVLGPLSLVLASTAIASSALYTLVADLRSAARGTA